MHCECPHITICNSRWLPAYRECHVVADRKQMYSPSCPCSFPNLQRVGKEADVFRTCSARHSYKKVLLMHEATARRSELKEEAYEGRLLKT